MMKPSGTRHASLTLVLTVSLVSTISLGASAPEQPRPPAPSLKLPATASAQVDERGFIRRWLVLEPIGVSGRLTTDEVDKVLKEKAFPDSTTLPVDGEGAPWAGQNLRWHAVDTVRYNVNLYHFAWALSKPTSNVLFWAVAVVDAPEDMRDVRLAIGSNAASAWWVNGQRVISLYNDRQAVIDDGVSGRITLRKGPNVIRVAIVNGGGATDFCARFLDSQDRPVTGLKVRLSLATAR